MKMSLAEAQDWPQQWQQAGAGRAVQGRGRARAETLNGRVQRPGNGGERFARKLGKHVKVESSELLQTAGVRKQVLILGTVLINKRHGWSESIAFVMPYTLLLI